MRRLFLISLFLLQGVNLCAQELIWEETIGGENIDWLQHAFENKAGNYVFSGYSHSQISGDKTEHSRGYSDYWIVETNPAGQIIWQKTIGGNYYEIVVKTLELEDDTYLLAGNSYSDISGEKTESSRGDRDLWLVKLNKSGNIVWQHTYGGDGTDELSDIIVTKDGGFIATSESSSTISGDKTAALLGGTDIWVLKLDANGEIEWQQSYGGNQTDITPKIHETNRNSFVIAASSASGVSGSKSEPSRGFGDYWIFEIGADSGIIWQKTIGGNNGDYIRDFVATSDGGYILAGDSGSGISGEKDSAVKSFVDVWLVKVSNTGTIEWQNTYAGANQAEWLENLVPSASGGFLISAMSSSDAGWDKTENSRGDRDYWMLKITDDGQICWDKTLGGNSLDQPLGAFEDSEGNFVVGGWTDSNASGEKTENSMGERDFWITKISQPEIKDPEANIPPPLTACDRSGDGFTEFDLLGLHEEIIGDQENIKVEYFDEDWNTLPSPLLDQFRNTVKNQQTINVRLTNPKIRCVQTDFQILLKVNDCGDDEIDGNIGFPKFFTPNGDGYNDTWKVDITRVTNVEFIYIYDRFGQLLNQLKPDTGWNGESNGRAMPADDYWYRAITAENRSITGHFSLIR
ncbi:hypothetical protein GCM10007103_06560 [Salinimicrobium marinum]|uniref:Gliding motility-associated C-terminal domain-containing protein n=1 Tax=Salinimicrobium marinum TaxID=680283 RepID=A0A918S9F3_9FLAO|nr:T9SS type B sorting domain-containing protein [Salinimicrobium marinum]GHA27808.1 hypothetical protein GCM10007103_06560 [Salinimicrobium marinum]